MIKLSGKAYALTAACLAAWLCADTVFAAELLPPGFRPLPLGVHALVGARVVVKPGEILETGTIVLRDGLIESVSTKTNFPADARVWDMQGATLYAGFIEPYLTADAAKPPVSTSYAFPVTESSLTGGGLGFYGAPGKPRDAGSTGPAYEIARITPEFRAIENYSPKAAALSAYRELGFTAAVIVPSKGILRGTSALVTLADENPNRTTLRADLFQHLAFDTGDNDGGVYPNSLMGVIAAIRQCFFDAQHYQTAHARYAQQPQGKRPEFNPALAALAPTLEKKNHVVVESGSALMNDRAARLARELGFDFHLVSSGEEWRRPDLAKATGASFIVPVNFPCLP
ncbi:MAG: hypothetical protein H7Y43_14630 [Akkermansiaceae bacterium]|nr:hypothetical protein [Verrucomicrobiales bacterium]